MGLPSVFETGRLGMVASRASIATSSHNISNSKTEGFSRQRVETKAAPGQAPLGAKAIVGRGALVSQVSRINDEYLEKQLRNAGRDLATYEEKDMALRQAEDIFNEMNGEGLNRLMTRFFNEFRKLSNEPDSEAVRQSVREAAQAFTNDFHRIRQDVEDVRHHIDARIEGDLREVNQIAKDIQDMNLRIRKVEAGGGIPNDLYDQRDLALKKLSEYFDLTVNTDNHGNYNVDIKGVGPFIYGGHTEQFYVTTSKADQDGKPEGAYEIRTTANANNNVTHILTKGKIGALAEVRDKTLSRVLDRLDDLAFTISTAVNEVHQQGYTRHGSVGVNFFKMPTQKERASELIGLSDEVAASVNNIATAAQPESPGDNRIALAISGLQQQRLFSDGKSTADDWYNSIVSDVGVVTAANRSAIGQEKDTLTQLNKMREQVSGVSLDEETANIMQYQQMFDASSHVIKVADEMLKTVLSLRG